MPIYEFLCKSCKFEFEEFAKINDPILELCPKCGNKSICQLISKSTGNVIMKADDYFKNVIEPEAKKIAKKINEGDENALADIVGDIYS